MKISAISAFSQCGSCSPKKRLPNFNGYWEDGVYQKYVHGGDCIPKRVYVPDKSENDYSIAAAWQKETGLLPIDWVKNNNPFNQTKSDVVYEIKGTPYLPLNILEASVKIKTARGDNTPFEKIDETIELAKLAGMEGNKAAVKAYESKMQQEMRDIYITTDQLMAANKMDNYLEGFGTNAMYAARYRTN